MIGFVYRIEIAGKYYIGSTSDIERRMYTHILCLNKGNHVNTQMQNRYNKYKKFSYSILFEFDNREDAYQKEQELLDIYCGHRDYMMVSNKAFGGPVLPGDQNGMFGKGHLLSGDRNGMFGRNHSEHSIQKMKHSWTDERLAAASKNVAGDKNPSKRPEVADKISKSKLGDKNPMKNPEVAKKVFEKAKQTNELKRKNNIPRYKTVICNYCGKVGAGGNMTRYHFENCKNK